MILTVASGKGGTGKTTIAVSLALAMADETPLFLDCDAEAPNAHIFLNPDFTQAQTVNQLVPSVDEGCCDGCGRCAEVCQYHALAVVEGKVLFFPELCHGCGSCTLQCPQGAIEEVPKALGLLEAGIARKGIRFARGVLDIGQPMAVPIIRALKNWCPFGEMETVILDAPPGVSCPVVESMSGADYVLLVTEPTPFGLHDLQLAVQLADELSLPVGVVLNRDGIGDRCVDEYCHSVGIPILLRIPYEDRIGKVLARGKSLVEALPEYLPLFRDLYTDICCRLFEREGAR